MANIPPFSSLCAFEAAVRLGGLARAASELDITTSAVSHRIRGLEKVLGAQLLERSTGLGGIHLTPAGTRLLPSVKEAISLLDDACADIRGARKRLTVSANVPFSTMWLAHRLAKFSSHHPATALNAIIQTDEPDFARYEIDLAIVHVQERMLRPDDAILMHEEVFPVCSPNLLSVLSESAPQYRLLQEAHENSPVIDWRNWVAEIGLAGEFESRVVRYGSFGQVIAAALSGAGLALGRSPLIDPELASGRLVRVLPGVTRPASWRFVLRAGPGRSHRMVTPLIEFLHAEVADAQLPPPA